MKLHLNKPENFNHINSCDDSSIQVGETTYKQSIILTSDTLEMWNVSEISALDEEDFLRFANLNCEVVLLGTGSTLTFPDPVITRPLIDKGIGLEVMDSRAACRTYNILVADGRRVSAGIIIK